MSDYKIKKYSFDKAKELGVQIKPSTNKKKKIDVFKNDKKIASIGDANYLDYPSYLEKDKKLAEERRKLYKARHGKRPLNTAGYFANEILW
jgi:hypothetical protein